MVNPNMPKIGVENMGENRITRTIEKVVEPVKGLMKDRKHPTELFILALFNLTSLVVGTLQAAAERTFTMEIDKDVRRTAWAYLLVILPTIIGQIGGRWSLMFMRWIHKDFFEATARSKYSSYGYRAGLTGCWMVESFWARSILLLLRTPYGRRLMKRTEESRNPSLLRFNSVAGQWTERATTVENVEQMPSQYCEAVEPPSSTGLGTPTGTGGAAS